MVPEVLEDCCFLNIYQNLEWPRIFSINVYLGFTSLKYFHSTASIIFQYVIYNASVYPKTYITAISWLFWSIVWIERSMLLSELLIVCICKYYACRSGDFISKFSGVQGRYDHKLFFYRLNMFEQNYKRSKQIILFPQKLLI